MAQIPNMNWMGNEPTGSAYDVYQYYLGGGSPGGTSTPSTGGGGGITSLPWYLQTGGGGGDFKGGGRYGNLDLSKGKTFNKNVFSRDMINMSPMQATKEGLTTPTNSWQNKEVQGFYNPTLGQYQTLAGKNINHLGLTVPSVAGMLFDKDFGKGPRIGDIEGTFTHGWESGKDKIKEGWEDEKDKWSKIFSSKKSKAKKEKEFKKHQAAIIEKERQREERKKEAAAKKLEGYSGTRDYDPTQGGGGHYSGRGGSGSGPQSGEGYGPWKAQGGMITDFNKDPEYKGWKKMYEANPEIGSLHEKHPTFIKFYKKYERDQKKFGGLAGLLYG